MNARTLVFLEPLAVFAIIMAYIWRLRFAHPWTWTLALGLVVLSHAMRREHPQTLGFRFKDLGACLRRFGPILISVAVVMTAMGYLLGTVRPLSFQRAVVALGLYLPWGLFQQYLLNGYFLRRFEAALSPRKAGILTAALFGAAHSPNWFLMLVTPVAGYAAIEVYRRYANLYFLGMAHAMLGFLLFVVVPDSVSHHLNVGPGWMRG